MYAKLLARKKLKMVSEAGNGNLVGRGAGPQHLHPVDSQHGADGERGLQDGTLQREHPRQSQPQGEEGTTVEQNYRDKETSFQIMFSSTADILLLSSLKFHWQFEGHLSSNFLWRHFEKKLFLAS